MKMPGRVFKIKCSEKKPRETGGSFWTALAERSGDSAFVWATKAGGLIQSGVALRSAAAVQILIWCSLRQRHERKDPTAGTGIGI
jgi:hypothetical protein